MAQDGLFFITSKKYRMIPSMVQRKTYSAVHHGWKGFYMYHNLANRKVVSIEINFV